MDAVDAIVSMDTVVLLVSSLKFMGFKFMSIKQLLYLIYDCFSFPEID